MKHDTGFWRFKKHGIQILKQAKVWEYDFGERLSSGCPPQEIYSLYVERLRWLQHERLIHLMVLMLTATVFLFSFGLALLMPQLPAAWVLSLLLAILTTAYIFHYFQLENLVQCWYLIEADLAKPGWTEQKSVDSGALTTGDATHGKETFI